MVMVTNLEEKGKVRHSIYMVISFSILVLYNSRANAKSTGLTLVENHLVATTSSCVRK